MKVLVTGSQGQLGRDIVNTLSGTCEVFSFGRGELDVTDQLQVQERIYNLRPDIVIHCAAYTSVDQAETETDKAFLVNAMGTRNVVVAAEKVGAKICYISTDYVFDGKGSTPYQEYDVTNPLNVYGRSKCAGEILVRSLSTRFFIVRTSWVFGKHGNNFVSTMLKLGRERASIKVVNDQVGSPTYTVDLAAFLAQLVFTEKYGIYHASNSGICSWYDFASEIFIQAGISVELIPCATEEYLRPAPRPAYSVMDHMAIRINGFTDLPTWQDSLHRFLQEIGEANKIH